MSEDNIINIVDRLIAKRRAKEQAEAVDYSVEVTMLATLIGKELTDIPDVHQRFLLATYMANTLLGAISEMQREYGASRSEIISALIAAAKAIAKRDLFSLND